MTRKDYEAIAAAIRKSERPASRETAASIYELSFRLASIFEADNPNFNRDRFIKACQS